MSLFYFNLALVLLGGIFAIAGIIVHMLLPGIQESIDHQQRFSHAYYSGIFHQIFGLTSEPDPDTIEAS